MSSLFEKRSHSSCRCPADVELSIIPRSVDIGGFEVHRALPHGSRQMVGPFIFWDQIGPGRFAAGNGVDVRPHPHIGLSTVTYLFEGSLDHRDSLGNDLRIVAGDVNLMTAGRGIVHSERTGLDVRRKSSPLSGIQSWLAQPVRHEEGDCSFTHFPASSLPLFDDDGFQGQVVLGQYQGIVSPIPCQWETLYVALRVKEGAAFDVVNSVEERAVHVASGTLEVDAAVYSAPRLLVLKPGSPVTLKARTELQLLLLGGNAMDGKRYIWWNFVASSVEKIKAAAERWRDGKFGTIPGDDKEFIPLPDLPFPSDG